MIYGSGRVYTFCVLLIALPVQWQHWFKMQPENIIACAVGSGYFVMKFRYNLLCLKFEIVSSYCPNWELVEACQCKFAQGSTLCKKLL